MIPEDFTLRRHYLTELKFKQETQFDDFIAVANSSHATPLVAQAPCSLPVLHYVSVGFFVLLLFVLF
jgi:hypothetical protein